MLIDVTGPRGKAPVARPDLRRRTRRRRDHLGSRPAHRAWAIWSTCEIVAAEDHDLVARPRRIDAAKTAKGSARPRRRPQIVAGDPRRNLDDRIPSGADVRARVGLFCRPGESVSSMSRTENPLSDGRTGARRFWNVPNTLDRQPAGAGRLASSP